MHKKFLFVLALVFSYQLSVGQVINGVVEKFQQFNIQFPQEKVYIHTDKQKYFSGESVWFKAYMSNALLIGTNPISNVLRVDLIDSENNIIDERILQVNGNVANGDFKLADSLSAGVYTIRSYTNWMRNFDHDFFHTFDFEVLNARNESKSTASESLNVSLDFFPEGGELIEGISSIVGFKAIDSNGRSVELSGVVVNKSGEKIADFKTIKSGIGIMLLSPKSTDELEARVIWNNQELSFKLPSVKSDGYAMRVNNSFESENITIAVESTNADLYNGFIIGHQSGKIFAMSANTSKKNSFALSIKREAFPPGICHLTFFDANGLPQSERLVFANYPKMIDLNISQKKLLTGKRSLARLDLELNNDTIGANLSASITPFAEVKYSKHSENIQNYFFLGSDLKGHIENPGYYFLNNKESFKALDNLLLTHGWRRFKWDEVLNQKNQRDYWVEDGITLSGKLLDYYKRKESRVGKISMSILNDNFLVIEGETDVKGNFFINQADFTGPTELLFQGKKRKGKKGNKFSDDVFIELDEWSPPRVSDSRGRVTKLERANEDFDVLGEKIKMINEAFNFDPDATLLDDVVVLGKKQNVVTETLTSVNVLYDKPSNRIIADSIIGVESFASAFDLIGRVPGVRLGGAYPNQSVLIRGATSISSSIEPLYLLNGIPIDGATVSTIASQDIAFVDVLKGADAVIYGSRASGGVVAIYTKRGETGGLPTGPGVLKISHPGYSKAREFYSPDYSISSEEHVKPDFRSTLYWDPNVIVDSSGNAHIEFYTSDQLGVFNIIIEGLSDDGIPIFKQSTIEILE